jgi:cytochrome P450
MSDATKGAAVTTTSTCQMDPSAFQWPSVELNQCPFPFYASIRAQGGVYAHPERDEFVVASHELVRDVLRRPNVFSSDVDGLHAAAIREALGDDAELPPDTIVTSGSLPMIDPPEHTYKRRLARMLVEPARLRSFEPLIRDLVNERIDAFIDRGEVEFCTEFANPLAFNLICAILGFDREEAGVFWSKGNPPTGHGARFLTEEQLAELRSRPDPDAFCERQVLLRHESPSDDFLSEFIRAHVERDGELKLEYLKNETSLLLNAGNETTARMLASTMRLLVENPDEMQRVRSEPERIGDALEESLRVEAPTQWVTRRCLTDTELGGVHIPAGALVALLYASANRDEERWEGDVDAFQVDRPKTLKYQLAFGAGAHFCLGAPIARLEGRIAYEILLQRLQNIRLAPGQDEVPNIDNIQKRAPKALFLQFDAA